MTKNIDCTAAIELLHSSEKIIITTHINPDGDAIGSALALYNLVVANGKEAHIFISESAAPANYKFLANSKQIKMYNPEIHSKHIYSADAIFLLDLSDISRIKTMSNVVLNSTARKTLIDHHIFPNNFADLIINDPTASSTGELIYYFIKQTKGKITKEIAEALYSAIYTDTAGFRFSTTPEIHRIVAELLECGIDSDYIYDKIYNTNSRSKIKLQGLALNAMEYHLDGKLILMPISSEMFKKTQTIDKDTEGFSQITLTVENALVGALLIESEEKREIRISLRSKGNINVRDVAAKYAGGGHLNAAGCRLQEISLETAKQIIINEIKQII
jgi:bifunctional oligoribonuclease and PAP phosphatase NrnA